MGGMAFLMLYITGGSVRYLVIMYSINVFLTFTLSQFGMVPALVEGPRDGGRSGNSGWR